MLPLLAPVRALFAALSFCSGGVPVALQPGLTVSGNLARCAEGSVIADAEHLAMRDLDRVNLAPVPAL
jgi:hypothetical protein